MPVSEQTFYGDAKFESISALFEVYPSKRVWTISATAGQLVRLPDARTLEGGGPYFYIINIGANTFTIRDNTNVILLNPLGTSEAAVIALADNTTRAGEWFILNRVLV